MNNRKNPRDEQTITIYDYDDDADDIKTDVLIFSFIFSVTVTIPITIIQSFIYKIIKQYSFKKIFKLNMITIIGTLFTTTVIDFIVFGLIKYLYFFNLFESFSYVNLKQIPISFLIYYLVIKNLDN